MRPISRESHARLRLTRLSNGAPTGPTRHFHVRKDARDAYGFDGQLFAVRGDVVFANLFQAHAFANTLNARRGGEPLRASEVLAMGLVHEIFHAVIALYRTTVAKGALAEITTALRAELGDDMEATLRAFVRTYPPPEVYRGEVTADEYLRRGTFGIANEEWMLEELLLLWLSNENPAYGPIAPLIGDRELRERSAYLTVIDKVEKKLDRAPRVGDKNQSLFQLLLAPMRHSPHSLSAQLEFMRGQWGLELAGLGAWRKLLLGLDAMKEEENWLRRRGQPIKFEETSGPARFEGELYENEPERFSADLYWMPRAVMIAKSTFVWLDQLSKKYQRHIRLLSDVPDLELDRLAQSGFTVLWLIGLWRRSAASKKIKLLHGQTDAVASAYSLYDYSIAEELGGDGAYQNLRDRAMARGIRLASDMVPNHMGIDSAWVINHPDWFLSADGPPFPGYSFNGPDVSTDDRVGIFLEDGYWNKTDAAVVFKRLDRYTGDVRFIYHGNDGTSMPWNDTAQLDYLKAEVREAVIQTILHVARKFPVIRFDAAMTLAKRHYQRLWFPLPGSGGDIPSRSEHAMTKERFDELFPNEFWREVVDRVAIEAPDTLLLAEAFWMMEGYFVRTLGMHRVYNSAFMNMLKREENANYKSSIKSVIAYNAQILKRHVNFMNNPDEDTAISQFGKDDKYFGVAVLLSTMPGLPMFGHGQIEGFTEKYGMEYQRARWDEEPDPWLIERHEREIFPLLKKRYLFSEAESFRLYDFVADEGHIDDDVFAYSNRFGDERALVVYHNKYKTTRGRILGLALAMGLRVEHGLFSVYRDHVTGLEHITDSESLAEGLPIELGAFKYHVFLDFREVVHTAERPYAELARELGGRGTKSLEESVIELRFRPIHLSFEEAISPGSLRYLTSGVPEAASALKGKIEHLRDGVQFFASQAAPLEPVVAKAEERFEAIVAALGKASEELGPRLGSIALSWLFIEALASLGNKKNAREALDDWFLDRAMTRSFALAGASADVAARDVTLVRLLAKSDETRDVVELSLDDPEGRAFLRVNDWDGVTWLEKESLELLVGAAEVALRMTAEEAEEMLDRAEKAGYRVLEVRRGKPAAKAIKAPGSPPSEPEAT